MKLSDFTNVAQTWYDAPPLPACAIDFALIFYLFLSVLEAEPSLSALSCALSASCLSPTLGRMFLQWKVCFGNAKSQAALAPSNLCPGGKKDCPDEESVLASSGPITKINTIDARELQSYGVYKIVSNGWNTHL